VSPLDDSPALGETMTCPTCAARQAWTAECRRCKSDLQLLVRAHELACALKLKTLSALRDGQLVVAHEAAATWHRLDQSPAAARLLAVCSLLLGDIPTALNIAQKHPVT